MHRQKAFWELTSHVLGGHLGRDSGTHGRVNNLGENHMNIPVLAYTVLQEGASKMGGRHLGYLPYLRSSLIL